MAHPLEAMLANIREEICDTLMTLADREDIANMDGPAALRAIAEELRQWALINRMTQLL